MEESRVCLKQTFDKAANKGTIPLKDRNQRLALFSIGQAEDGERAVRFYGACRNQRQAKSLAAAIMKDDPHCNLVMGELHKWLPVASNEVVQDAKLSASMVAEFEAHDRGEKIAREKAFAAKRQEFLRAGPVDAAICKDHINPQFDLEETLQAEEARERARELEEEGGGGEDGADGEDGEEGEDGEGGGGQGSGAYLSDATKLANQSIAIVSFRRKPDVLDRFCVQVMRFVANDEEADVYVRNSAGDAYKDQDIHPIPTHTWCWPKDAQHAKKIYRDELLNNFLNPKTASPADIRETLRQGDEAVQDAILADDHDALARAVGEDAFVPKLRRAQ